MLNYTRIRGYYNCYYYYYHNFIYCYIYTVIVVHLIHHGCVVRGRFTIDCYGHVQSQQKQGLTYTAIIVVVYTLVLYRQKKLCTIIQIILKKALTQVMVSY